MNIERLKVIIDEWYQYLDKKGIEELEEQIGMPFKDFVIFILNNIYNYYKDSVMFIPADCDKNDQYILKPHCLKTNNGVLFAYSLEDFLINRLLRNISEICYTSNQITSSSYYDHETGLVSLDSNRFENHLHKLEQKRKVAVHEILHGLKTQFNDDFIYRYDDYYSLKEKIKAKFPNLVNDFHYEPHTSSDPDIGNFTYNGSYSHSGIYSRKNKQLNNLDETLNEHDSFICAQDGLLFYIKLDGGLILPVSNPESSNAYITNYGVIMAKLIDKKDRFAGMFLDPEILTSRLNYSYGDIFREEYNSSNSATEIFVDILNRIKDEPNNTKLHIDLLETLYKCNVRYNQMYNKSQQSYNNNLSLLGTYSLQEVHDDKTRIYSGLSYATEANTLLNGVEKK